MSVEKAKNTTLSRAALIRLLGDAESALTSTINSEFQTGPNHDPAGDDPTVCRLRRVLRALGARKVEGNVRM